MERSRSHILEDKSLTYLKKVLPDLWVVHRYEQDYGIDVQIEIFSDKDCNANGNRFYGQLKATDKDVSKDKLRIKRKHLEYWDSQDEPVALYRYYDSTKKIRWCWAHELSWRLNTESSSLEVSNYLKNWDEVLSPKEIESFLLKRKQALFLSPKPPYIITINHDDEGLSKASLLAALVTRKIGSSSFKVLTNISESDQTYQIQMAPGKLACSFCGLHGYVMHQPKDTSLELMSNQIICAIFFCAVQHRCIHLAKVLAKVIAPLILHAKKFNYIEILIDGLIYTLGIKPAYDLIESQLKEEKDPINLFLMIAFSASIKYDDIESLIDLFHSWLELPSIKSKQKGAIAYNLGKALSQKDNLDDAYLAYKKALDYEPLYKKRSYFWSDWGAAAFGLGDFTTASKYYSKAMKLELSDECRWRLAESLFNQGKFAIARDHLLKVTVEKIPDIKNGMRILLLLTLCKELVSRWKIESQTLKVINEAEHKRLQDHSPINNENELLVYLGPLIEKNAIDTRLAFNAGILAYNSNNFKIATYRFITCTLIHPLDKEAWINGIVSSFNSGEDTQLLSLIISAAYFSLGEEFLPQILGLTSNLIQIKGDISKWEELIHSVIKELEPHRLHKEQPILRVHGKKSTKIYPLP